MSKTIIGTRINQSIINELNERKKVFSRKEGGNKYTISPEDMTKHFQKVVNMRLISLNKSTRNNETISGTNVILYNNYDKSFEELYPEETPYGEQNYKKHIPTINSANVQMYGKFGAVKKTSIEFTCGNIEQLTYMFDLYQTPGGICIFEFGWGDTFKSSKLNQTAINNLENQSYNEILKTYNYFDLAYENKGRYGIILGIVTNFSQSINENGGFTASLEMTSLGDNIFKMNMETENGSNFNFEVLKKMFEKKYSITKTTQTSGTVFTSTSISRIKYLRVLDLFNEINLLLDNSKTNIVINHDVFAGTPMTIVKKIEGKIYGLNSKIPDYYINKTWMIGSIRSLSNTGGTYNGKYWREYMMLDEDGDPDQNIEPEEQQNNISNTLISEKLISKAIDESKTLEEFIDIILSTINQCLMGFVNFSMKSLDENDIVIINEKSLNYEGIKGNTTKFDIQTYDNIFKTVNYSSNLTDMLKAHALFNLKKGYKINIINDTNSDKKDYSNIFSPGSENFWNYEFSENKSLNRIFNIPLTLTTDGITGMTYGNAFTLNYLMDIYKKQEVYPCFFITKINHNLTDSNWETEIVGQFLPLKK